MECEPCSVSTRDRIEKKHIFMCSSWVHEKRSIVDGTRAFTCLVHMLAPRAGSPCCRLADLSLGSYFGLTYRLRGSRMVARSRGEAEESGASCAAGARGWPVCFAGRVNMLAGQSGLRVRAPVARKQARCARPRHASREPSDSPCWRIPSEVARECFLAVVRCFYSDLVLG